MIVHVFVVNLLQLHPILQKSKTRKKTERSLESY